MNQIENTNAKRYINAYNQIDNGLRAIHNFKRSTSFSELVRKTVSENHIVRKYEDDLIDYGRLRNAIIHRSNDAFIIAQPHIEVVEQIEKIARLITTPPNALNTVCKHSVLTVEYDVTLENVIKLMSQRSYSNLPVYKKGEIIGLANGQKILENIGRRIEGNIDINNYLKTTKVHEVLKNGSPFKQYEVVPATASIEHVLNLFNHNPKLLAVLITKNGTMKELSLGIITTTNVLEMNNILDNY